MTAIYPTTTPSKKWTRLVGPALTIAALTFFVYIPIRKAGFIWDDDQHITQNRLLTDLDGLGTLWTKLDALPQYYPLTHTFFWIEHHLWDDDPFGYHVINVLVHALNAILIWRIIARLGIPGAGLGALLFALHPVNVETVAWISEGKNTFSTLFYLLSLTAFLRTSHFDLFKPARRQDGQWYTISLVLFIAALLCKTVSASLPAAILLLIYFRAGKIRLRNVLALFPYFAVGILLAVNTAYLERTHVRAVGPDWQFASSVPGEIVARCLIAGRAVWFYLAKLCVPLGLSFEYRRWHIDIASPLQYAFPFTVITGLLALFWMRKLIGRGPLVAALFFVGSLVPALGFNNIFPMRYSLVADHFQYLACIGPLAAIAASVSFLSTRRAGEYIPAELIVGIVAILTWFRCSTFVDNKTLFLDAIEKNPRAWMSLGNYGSALATEGRFREAEVYLLQSIRLHPDNPIMATRLGRIGVERKAPDVAARWYRIAIKMDPHYAESHYELAHLLEETDVPGALQEYQEAVTIQPKHGPACLAYGTLLGRLGRFSEAADQLKKTVEIDPRSKRARSGLIAALEHSGRFDEAAEQINEYLDRYPNDNPALFLRDLGIVETLRHRQGPAVDALRRSLQIKPDQPDVRERLNALTRPPSR